MRVSLPDEAATLEIAGCMARCLPRQLVLYLRGPLGAGKTTLIRGLIQSLGFQGRVKSPTYGLVERYAWSDHLIHHLDLYRLADPEELEFIGIRDLVAEAGVIAIEWPERGTGMLPDADVICALEIQGMGRELVLTTATQAGQAWLDAWVSRWQGEDCS